MRFKILMLPTGIGKSRLAIFSKNISKLGGINMEKYDPTITHIIIDEKLDLKKVSNILKISIKELSRFKIIKTLWLSASVDQGQFIDTEIFELKFPVEESNLKQINDKPSQNSHVPISDLFTTKLEKRSLVNNINYSDYEEEISCDKDLQHSEENFGSNFTSKKGKWICNESSTSQKINHNQHITDILEKMLKTYEEMNEKWKALSYRKAIIALKNHPTAISSFTEAKNLHGVGERLAEKIWEISESGKLRKLDELNSCEETQALNIFNKVWGVGPQTAKNWVIMGFRNIEELRIDKNKLLNLTRHQKHGIKLYEDLCLRMDRIEVEQIEAIIKDVSISLEKECEVITCGSYRRGQSTCGDVDILITHKQLKETADLFNAILNKLRELSFLTDDLVIAIDGSQHKYLGVCKLPASSSIHRRIDIIVVPYKEFIPALVYFTGSGHFNRSMRNLASKMGMSLNEHGLFKDVIRVKGVKTSPGVLMHTPTEESIFKILGIPYRQPEERDF